MAVMEQATPASEASLRACIVVLGAFLSLFCSVGYLNAFGVFQSYYVEHILRDKSEFDISWIGSVAIFLLYLFAPIAGILVDRVGPRILLMCGSVGQLLAVFMTSLCTQYYQFFLAQALLLGISMSFVTWPPAAVVSRTMPRNRGFALGLVIGGSSLGGVIWPIMIEQLLNTRGVSFGWTMRIVGFVMLPLLAIACVAVAEPAKQPAAIVPSRAPSVLSDEEAIGDGASEKTEEAVAEAAAPLPSIVRNPTFIRLCVALGLGYFGLFNPFFYISSYAPTHGANSQMAFYLISIINGSSLFGRIVPGFLADRFGHYNLCTLALFFSGIIAFCWTSVSTLAGLIIWSIAYGFTSGAIMSLQGACAGKIATHQTQGKAIGMLQGSLAITSLVGSPIGGQLVGRFGYLSLSMFTGATLLSGGLVLACARLRVERKILHAF